MRTCDVYKRRVMHSDYSDRRRVRLGKNILKGIYEDNLCIGRGIYWRHTDGVTEDRQWIMKCFIDGVMLYRPYEANGYAYRTRCQIENLIVKHYDLISEKGRNRDDEIVFVYQRKSVSETKQYFQQQEDFTQFLIKKHNSRGKANDTI